MGLHSMTDLELVLPHESDCPCDCLPFEEDDIVTSCSSRELEATLLDLVTETFG